MKQQTRTTLIATACLVVSLAASILVGDVWKTVLPRDVDITCSRTTFVFNTYER